MKQRYSGRVQDGNYEVLDPTGGVVRQIPLEEARGDSKILAAIRRNGWQEIPEA